jgi:hypothetical protein
MLTMAPRRPHEPLASRIGAFPALCVTLLVLSLPVTARAATAVTMPQVMRFGMHMTLHVTGSGDQGGDMDITWTGDADLTLTKDRTGGCYTPRFDDDRLDVHVQNFRMVGASGTAAELTSPQSYGIQIGVPKLNYCDADPVLQVAFNARGFPMEEVTAEGQSRRVMLFGNFLMGVLVVNNLNTDDANAASGRKESDWSAASAPPDPQLQREMQALQSLVSQHQGDTRWLMSAQGRAVIAQLQADATAQGAPDLPAPDHSSGGANDIADVLGGFSSAKLHWTKGASRVVDETLHVDKDRQHIELNIFLDQKSAR